MEHSIALVTGTTSGLGYAAARLLAAQGYREVIIVTRAQLGPDQGNGPLNSRLRRIRRSSRRCKLDLDTPSSVQSAIAELVKRGLPIDFLLLNAGMVGGKKRVLTAARIRGRLRPR